MRVYLADLCYLNDWDTNQPVPLNVGYIAAYLLAARPGDEITIFKDPLHLVRALSAAPPDVLGQLPAPAVVAPPPAGFRRHVEEWLPDAEQIVLEGSGHVPQVERPERTNGLLERFFARIDALGRRRGLEAA